MRILLAEDNPANQKLAAFFLRARGHIVELAGEGLEAIRMAEQNRYDVILMDVQMPEMDGLEASAEIRKRETAGNRVPIIGMTAHTMHGYDAHCIEAGMDACLSKPVKRETLIELVEQWGNKESAVKKSATSDRQSLYTENTKPFEFDEAIARLGSAELFRDMANYFFQDGIKSLTEIAAAAEAGDATTVSNKAHRLKGTVVYLGAEAAAASIGRVEDLARAGDLSGAIAAIESMHKEVARLAEALRDRLATNSLAPT